MNSLTLKSPAKLNLYLKILRKRSDGYHDLATLFHRISLADTLHLKKRAAGFELRCSRADLSVGEDNLITKAYRKLEKAVPGLGGVSVFLKKHIPMGAGLGGGSSNAAFFLLGMKKLYKLKISQVKLLKIGSELGADVPFFLYNLNQAIGLEKGDKLRKKTAKKRHVFVLATSPEGLNTGLVYRNLPPQKAASLTKVSRAITLLCAFLENRNYGRAASFLENDLEVSAFHLRPSLHAVFEQFQKQEVPLVRMTGSGPTIFAILSHLREAKRVQKRLQQDLPNHKILICQSY